MTKLSALAQILTTAVRAVNKENGIKLKKVLELGDEQKGAGIYRDAEYNEYRVIYIAEKEHLIRADYHTADKQDAWDTAKLFTDPEYPEDVVAEQLGDIPDPITEDYLRTGRLPGEAEPAAEPVQLIATTPVLRSRPRGFYSHPSPLLKGLLMRTIFLVE